MKYLSDKSKIKKRYFTSTLIFVAFALFIYYWSSFRAVAYPVAEPVLLGYGSTKTIARFVPSFVSTYVTSHKKLAESNKNLEINIERLENQLAEKEAFIRETFLVNEVEASQPGVRVLPLYPLAEDVTKLYSTVLLSKGYKDDIQKGSVVYIRGMQPVCEIIDVYDRTSLCELFSKGGRITEGVTSSSTVTLTLLGEGGGSFVASLPKDIDVQVGESVYLRGDQAYTLGTVVMVQEDSQATGVKIYVKGAYNPAVSSIFYVNTK